MDYVMLNHRLLPRENALVPVGDRGFRYGDGVFDALTVHDGVPYRFDWHVERLARGLAAIRLSCDLAFLHGECRELLRKNDVRHGLLRIQITRGGGGRGYLPGNAAPTAVIETLPLPETPEAPVSLWLSSWQKPAADALPVNFKLCQGLNSTLARLEAADHGCFDSLQLNAAGQLAETSSANLFWIRNGELFTPALSCGILEGSTRDALMRLVQVTETEAMPEALAEAETVFITNAALKILPVAKLLPANLSWNSAPAAAALNQKLAADMAKHCREHIEAWK